jgi:hypothetical protein
MIKEINFLPTKINWVKYNKYSLKSEGYSERGKECLVAALYNSFHWRIFQGYLRPKKQYTDFDIITDICNQEVILDERYKILYLGFYETDGIIKYLESN